MYLQHVSVCVYLCARICLLYLGNVVSARVRGQFAVAVLQQINDAPSGT